MSDTQLIKTRYNPDSVSTGIVHIGLGAFHRAHQAVYIERCLNRNNGGPWGICSANIRSNYTLVEQLRAQNYHYHVVEHEDKQHATVREVSAIRNALFAGTDKTALLQAMTQPNVRIVTLTVTEKGYYLSAAERRLRTEDPDIQHDIENPDSPKTVPGVLLCALRQRHQHKIAPFTVLSCDNLPENGVRTRTAVLELAKRQCPELVSWLETAVAFPSSMVDRIVPAMDAGSVANLQDSFALQDAVPLSCEQFSQWVVEDHFTQGRPDWEFDGVQMVDDVHPFETMKLRLLNGSHSVLAYVGSLCGWQTVSEAIADSSMHALINAYMQEALETLDMPAGVDTASYIQALLQRFANDSLNHKLSQIAMDGSHKIPQRWLDSAVLRAERGLPLQLLAFAVAGWMHYVRGMDVSGNAYEIADPQASSFQAVYNTATTSEEVVYQLLALRDIFSMELANNQTFSQAVLAAYVQLKEEGAAPTLKKMAMVVSEVGQ